MERVSGDRYVISLKYNNNLCLTAMNGAMPKSGKVSFLNDAGNVCWSIRSGGIEQMWTAEEVGGSSESGNIIKQYLVPPYPVSGITADYDEDCEMIKEAKKNGKRVCAQYPFTVHWGVDFAGRNSSYDTTVLKNIKGSGYGEVMQVNKVSNDRENYLGNTILIKYPNAAYGTGSSKRDIYFLYCHLAEIKVSEGEEVTPETLIAVAGKTGEGADAIHLHLEAYTSEISKSKTEDSSVTSCVDPTNYLFNSGSGDNVGIRKLVPDCEAPIYGSDSCTGDSGCSHTNRLYFYNKSKIAERGNYQDPTF